ncbi:bifunctional diguanylate cyclase/phosphodiesterase, partial [Rhodoferax sp.]|uniref:sensor domain-containing protein n=1 Tax=Rhodoferax sp. TaxID=50421 RepID=UPI00261DFC66
DAQHLQTLKLLEDLRIYQVELELQNEELRAAQQDAELARKRYQYLFDQLPLAALVVDGQGVVDECNPLADALLGERKKFVHADMRLWSLLTGKDRSRVSQALRSVAAGETLVIPQVHHKTAQGQVLSFDVHLIGLSIDYKLERRVLMLWADRSAELARQADQQFYTLLLDASDAFMYATDTQGKMLLANHALLNFVGRSREQVVGQPRESFLPLRDAILHAEADQKVLHSKQAITVEEQVHGAHERMDFLTRKFPLRNLQGEVYGVGGISTDITALKDQQRQMLLSEAVFQNSAEAIIITDASTRILRVNPAFTRLTGFSAEAVLGQKTNVLKSGRQDAAFYTAMWQAITQTGTWSGELNNRRSDGRYCTVWSTINAVRDAEGNVLNYIAVQADVTPLHNAKMALVHQASYDSLTGLPNRSLFNDRMAQLMSASLRHNSSFALLFVDLDRFKEVNDTLGHQVGDQLLREVAHRLQLSVRAEDTVARIGGDEFVLLLPGSDVPGAQAVAANVLTKLREPMQLQDSVSYRPMASVGLALYPQDGQTPDALLRCADLAMYDAKIEGRNRFAVYTPELSRVNDKRFAIQTELAQAIEQQQLRVYFQPKCRLSDGALQGAEALVRWQRPGNGLVLPGEFIGVAEKTGLLVALDHWVMNDALRQLGSWLASGQWQPGWRLSINQNVADLKHPRMLENLQQQLNQHRVPASALELELTEDALLEHTPEQLAQLADIQRLGVSVSIDDFGTGYSSLAYLRQLPVSVIKIDQSFVKGMLTHENDAVLVQTIVDMAHNLGHTLVAEGIEQETQRQHLAGLGVELGQGFLFDPALDAQAFAQRWLTASQPS